MAKKLIKTISAHVKVYKYDCGIVVVEDGSTGAGHSCHPNIDKTGSVSGMQKQGYWRKEDVTIKAGGFIYNISRKIGSDDYDKVAQELCQCPACKKSQ